MHASTDRLAPPAATTPPRRGSRTRDHPQDPPGNRAPRLAAALATTLLTRASFQQLLTVRAEDLGTDAATLAFHDPARYTDGCASHPIPAWARPFLRAAASFAVLTDSRELLAHQDERPHILSLAEIARLRPPQPPLPQSAGASGVMWDWAERRQAERYETLLSRLGKPSRPRR
ncbi:hypothetical protein ACUN22_35800 [Streptomyces anulatus]|uniref:hypothetical protein n=1 Tax=Streptomyces anulatus TaxID=1892 RepID=UPI00403D8CF7